MGDLNTHLNARFCQKLHLTMEGNASRNSRRDFSQFADIPNHII